MAGTQIAPLRGPGFKIIPTGISAGPARLKLYNLFPLGQIAVERKFGLPAINPKIFPICEDGQFKGPSTVRAALKASEQLGGAAMIIEMTPFEFDWYLPPEQRVRGPKLLHDHLVQEMAASIGRTDIFTPMALHLDHVHQHEAINRMLKAVRSGFTSVAFDPGKTGIEDLVKQTQNLVNIFHPRGVTLEVEMDTLGEDSPTNPEQVAQLAKETGADAAVLVFAKNLHGAEQGSSELDIELIRRTRQLLPPECVIVLHGGSGFAFDQLTSGVMAGITKVNYATHLAAAALAAIPGAYPTLFEIALPVLQQNGIDTITQSMEPGNLRAALNASNRSLYKLFQSPFWRALTPKDIEPAEDAMTEGIVSLCRALRNKNTARYFDRQVD